MGNYTSKFFSHCEEHEKVRIQTDLTMSTIGNNLMCTPLMSKKVSADPRSITVGITRTPIQIAATPSPSARPVASAIPKHLQMKKYLETNLDLILPAVTPVKRILDPRSPNILQQRTPILIKTTTTEYLSPIVVINEGPDMKSPEDLDPRSPAANFDRTPILKSKLTEQEDSPSCNSRIENVGMKMSYCETIGNDNILEIQTLPKIVTTVKSRNLEERIKSCETEDSENDVHKELEENVYSEDSEESDSEDQITVIHNPRGLVYPQEAQIDSKTDELLEAILKNELKIDEDASNSAANLEIQNTENKGKIVIWRDSLSSLTSVNHQENHDSPRAPKHSTEIITVCDNDVIPKVSKNDTPKSHVKNEYKSKLPVINKSIKNKQSLKKEVKGVFDDGNIEAGRSRVPLAIRYNKNEIDISSKSPQLVLRTKNLSTQPGQQENTPPNSKRYRSKIKANGTHWDADMSVII